MAAQSETGTIAAWKDDRGFGFIRTATNNKEDDVFIHISSLSNMSRRPRLGDVIHYDLAEDNGKVKAINAFIEGVEPLSEVTRSTCSKWLMLGIAVLSSFITFVAMNSFQ